MWRSYDKYFYLFSTEICHFYSYSRVFWKCVPQLSCSIVESIHWARNRPKRQFLWVQQAELLSGSLAEAEDWKMFRKLLQQEHFLRNRVGLKGSFEPSEWIQMAGRIYTNHFAAESSGAAWASYTANNNRKHKKLKIHSRNKCDFLRSVAFAL